MVHYYRLMIGDEADIEKGVPDHTVYLSSETPVRVTEVRGSFGKSEMAKLEELAEREFRRSTDFLIKDNLIEKYFIGPLLPRKR